MGSMTFHVLGVPHTVSSKEYNACAYTQKIVKFCKMMTARGHKIYHYGHEDSKVDCFEHVTVITNKDFEISYGSHDWKAGFFKFDMNDHAYQTFFKNAIIEVGKRKGKNEFILPFWGAGVRPVCDAHPDLITVEPGIGYAGGFWARFKVFESYSMLHAFGGMDAVGHCKPEWYNVVIPNYFDLDDFEFREKKDDYFLFIGRVYEGKGIHAAIQTTAAIGAKLKVAGQSNLFECGYKEIPPHVEFIGYADVEKRKELMAGAKGAFVASLYNEPFGGVQIECLLSGTPTITTDWGAFTENNIHGVTGYRCRTFNDFVEAAKNIGKIDPRACRKFGENFSLENVAVKYEKYFRDILNVYENKGWYEIFEDPHFLKTHSYFKKSESSKKKVVFFTQSRWAFGSIHNALSRSLFERGITAELMDWSNAYHPQEIQSIMANVDYMITQPDGFRIIKNDFRVPSNKLILVAHGQIELLKAIEENGVEMFDEVKEYAVVSEILKQKSAEFGVKRIPKVVKIGIDVDRFDIAPAKELKRIGYAASYAIKNYKGEEIKRGHLVERACQNAGLEFAKHNFWHYMAMPEYYKSVDAVIMSSTEESVGLPMMEAAAAGRLTIGTPVGYHEHNRIGHVVSLEEQSFLNETVAIINYYKNNPAEFSHKCSTIQHEARSKLGWDRAIDSWVDLINSLN